MSNRANAAALGLMVWIILSDAPLFECVCVSTGTAACSGRGCGRGGKACAADRSTVVGVCVSVTPFILNLLDCRYACVYRSVCALVCVCVSVLVCVLRWFVFIAAPGRHQLCCSGFVEAEQRQRLMENNNSTLLLLPAAERGGGGRCAVGGLCS